MSKILPRAVGQPIATSGADSQETAFNFRSIAQLQNAEYYLGSTTSQRSSLLSLILCFSFFLLLCSLPPLVCALACNASSPHQFHPVDRAAWCAVLRHYLIDIVSFDLLSDDRLNCIPMADNLSSDAELISRAIENLPDSSKVRHH